MRRIIMDMSSLLWSALLAGKDQEGGRSVPHPEKAGETVWLNSAQWGLDNFVSQFVSYARLHRFTPMQCIAVFEGFNSKSLRTAIDPNYKAQRAARAPEVYTEFQELTRRVKQALLELGAQAVTQDHVEADDVVAYLARHIQSPTLVISNDGDLAALKGPSTDVLIGGILNENKYGPFPFQHITLYKALVGDSSDNIKGAKGFGPKAFTEVYATFDDSGLDILDTLIRQRKIEALIEDVAECKVLQRLLDDRDSVYRSYDCARLYPEKVNTLHAPLQWQVGMVKPRHDDTHPALKQWAGQVVLVHAGNFQRIKQHLADHTLSSPFVALDIETSTPQESDEWVEHLKKREDSSPVDVHGSELTGLGLTYGDNCQFSIYATVDHVETDAHKNISVAQARQLVEQVPDHLNLVIHNFGGFEGPVLYRHWSEAWADNGWQGFLPNVRDSMIAANYMDENEEVGLKSLSKRLLDYQQTTYAEVTQGRKMNQLTAAEVIDYGVDDTICSAAIFNHCRLVMELEKTWRTYEEVETYPAYLTALAFVQGLDISLERMREIENEDDAAYAGLEARLHQHLVRLGWDGTVYQPFEASPAGIKAAFELVTGRPLQTQVRTPDKLYTLIEAEGETLLASILRGGDAEQINHFLQQHFKGAPQFNLNSPTQRSRLMYEVLQLPARIRNKATEKQRAAGQREGSPKTDNLALQYALMYDCEDAQTRDLVTILRDITLIETRRKLFYKPYRYVQHWTDNKVRPSLRQCSTVTRRYSASQPNVQQLPKRGEGIKFREVFIAHRPDAVVISMDFSGQELRVIADYSRDENMLACFTGDQPKDMHALTATGIVQRKVDPNITYEIFEARRKDEATAEEYSAWRALGKKCNFTTEYGAQAPKLAQTLLITEEEAQQYIDAKHEAFPRAEEWKQEVVLETRRTGFAATKLGGRRHLAAIYRSGNTYDMGKADRQAVNHKIQGSSGEMTKLAMARIWRSGVLQRYDARFYFPVHDELVFSCRADQVVDFISEVHPLMVADYAGMTVPIVSSISLGRNFGEQIEVGESVAVETIEKALYDLGFQPAKQRGVA